MDGKVALRVAGWFSKTWPISTSTDQDKSTARAHLGGLVLGSVNTHYCVDISVVSMYIFV